MKMDLFLPINGKRIATCDGVGTEIIVATVNPFVLKRTVVPHHRDDNVRAVRRQHSLQQETPFSLNFT
jgi:hypothetical protein